ncbi:putative JmjC domain-containing histone demethylation protein 2C [Geranomyces michiganensis]|nr:putative JmjC domain-containing histone demethylation protein 2C [Geranomyces michiganensis]
MPKKQRHSLASTPPPSSLPLRRQLLRENPFAFNSIPLPGFTVIREPSPTPTPAHTSPGRPARRPSTKLQTPRSPPEESSDDEVSRRGSDRVRAARNRRKRAEPVSSARSRQVKTEPLGRKQPARNHARLPSSSPSKPPARRRSKARVSCADQSDDLRAIESSSDDSSSLSSVVVSSDSDGEGLEASRVRGSSEVAGGSTRSANTRKNGRHAPSDMADGFSEADVGEPNTSSAKNERRKNTARQSLETTQNSRQADNPRDADTLFDDTSSLSSLNVSSESESEGLEAPRARGRSEISAGARSISVNTRKRSHAPSWIPTVEETRTTKKRRKRVCRQSRERSEGSHSAEDPDEVSLSTRLMESGQPPNSIGPTLVRDDHKLNEDSDDAPLQKRAILLLRKGIHKLSEDSDDAPLQKRAAILRQKGIHECSEDSDDAPLHRRVATLARKESNALPPSTLCGASLQQAADELEDGQEAAPLERGPDSPPDGPEDADLQADKAGALPQNACHPSLTSRTVSALHGDTQESIYPLPSSPVELESFAVCAKSSRTKVAARSSLEAEVVQHDGPSRDFTAVFDKELKERGEETIRAPLTEVKLATQLTPRFPSSLAAAPPPRPAALKASRNSFQSYGISQADTKQPRPQFPGSLAAAPPPRAAALKASRNSFQSNEVWQLDTTPPLPLNVRPVVVKGPAAKELKLQTTTCQAKVVSSFEKCTACVLRKGGQPCRFSHFRALSADPNTGGTCFVSATPTREWAREDVFPKGVKVWPRMADVLEYQLFFVRDAFMETVDKELEHVTREGAPPHCVKAPDVGTRQTCDYCEQGIYNVYYLCIRCGKDICLLCSDEGWGPNAAQSALDLRAATALHRCTYRRRHGLEDFLLVGRWSIEQMQVAREWMVGWFETHGERLRQQIGVRVREPPPNRSHWATSSPDVANAASESQNVAALIDAPHPDLLSVRAQDLTLELFQQCWRDRKAVFVTDMGDQVLEGWSPAAFRDGAGSDRATLVDVISGDLHPDSPLGPFFDGFGGGQRDSDTDPSTERRAGQRRPVKLKDWPTDMHFRQKLPDICARLLDVLPAPDYAHPDGVLNLAAAIPSEDVPPDLGPKLYAAYGYDPAQTGATTNLHLDVADAANVMVWSQSHVARDPSIPPHRFDGAIWELFPPASLSKLRTYLRETYTPRPSRVDDPIHDQTAYLHPHHLAELRALHGVTPIRLHQHPGDVVFVPAGFAHQVANYGDCIKAAVDFVSPEGMRVCDALCGEFRRLSRGHGRRGDTVCVGKIAWSVLRKAVTECGTE